MLFELSSVTIIFGATPVVRKRGACGNERLAASALTENNTATGSNVPINNRLGEVRNFITALF